MGARDGATVTGAAETGGTTGVAAGAKVGDDEGRNVGPGPAKGQTNSGGAPRSVCYIFKKKDIIGKEEEKDERKAERCNMRNAACLWCGCDRGLKQAQGYATRANCGWCFHFQKKADK